MNIREFLKQIDPEGLDGTVQSFLLNFPSLDTDTENAYQQLVGCLYRDKATLVKLNVQAWQERAKMQDELNRLKIKEG